MPFHWNRPYQENLFQRYPAETIGLDAWRTLVEDLAQRSPTELLDTTLEDFIEEASKDAQQNARAVAFSSHTAAGRSLCRADRLLRYPERARLLAGCA
jgi:hypothetical protein